MDDSGKLRILKEASKKRRKNSIIGFAIIIIAFGVLFTAGYLPIGYHTYAVLIFFILFLISVIFLGSSTNEQILARRLYRFIDLLNRSDIKEDVYKKNILDIVDLLKFNRSSSSNWVSFNREIRKKLSALTFVFEKKVPSLLFGNTNYPLNKSKLEVFLIDFAFKLVQENENSKYMDDFVTQFNEVPDWNHQLRKHYTKIVKNRVYTFGSKRIFERPVWALITLGLLIIISAGTTFLITGNSIDGFESGALVGVFLTYVLNKA